MNQNPGIVSNGLTTVVSGSVNAWTGLINFAYDYVLATYPDDITEVYTFKSGTIGGIGGVTVGTITVIYSDNTKELISSAYRN